MIMPSVKTIIFSHFYGKIPFFLFKNILTSVMKVSIERTLKYCIDIYSINIKIYTLAFKLIYIWVRICYVDQHKALTLSPLNWIFMCAPIRWIEYNTVHASAELNLEVFKNKIYSKDHNFKTNQDFSFKFWLNVIYILQNVLFTLT